MEESLVAASDATAGAHSSSSSRKLYDKLGRLAYHVTQRLADLITRLNDWQRTLDYMLQVCMPI